jgi:DNA (cytosine-5)-methyltransferase 1
VLNAADFGVPQDRRRLFLIGTRPDLPAPHYPQPRPNQANVAEAIGDLPNADDFAVLRTSDEVSTIWETHSSYARQLRGFDRDPHDYSYPRPYDPHLLTSSLRTAHTPGSRARFSATLPGKTEPISRFRRLAADGLCNTLRAGTDSARGAHTSPRPIHPLFPRVITVREAARLHSYPDWFRFHATKWHGCRQIGNSVPPLLARAIASEILKAQGRSPSRPPKLLQLGSAQLLHLDMSSAADYFQVSRTTIAQRSRKVTSDQDWQPATAQ